MKKIFIFLSLILIFNGIAFAGSVQIRRDGIIYFNATDLNCDTDTITCERDTTNAQMVNISSIGGGGGGGTWGSITGTLSNQTDLNSALALKAPLISPTFTTPNIGFATGSISGNAATATTLSGNGANCSSGNSPLGVDASGTSENCFDVTTQSEFDALVNQNVKTTGTPQFASLTLSSALAMSSGGLGSAFVDPGDDRMIFWDDSVGQNGYLDIQSPLQITDVGGVQTLGVDTLDIGEGGTGQITRQAALDALADATNCSEDDILTIDASNNVVCAANLGGVFEEAAGLITQKTTGNDVAFGDGQIDGAKVSVNGDSDQIQFAVKAHSTQNENIAEFQDSDGTVLVAVQPDGSIVGTGVGASDLTIGGITATGVVDMGGATSTEIVNGANPTVDANGEISVDTTSGSGAMVRFYAGASYQLPAYQCRSFNISGVTASGDFGAIWKSPWAITMRSINVVQVGATNVVGQLDECDSGGASCATIDSSDITADGGNDADDGSLSNASVDANDWVGWHTTSVSGTNTYIGVTFCYTVDAVN